MYLVIERQSRKVVCSKVMHNLHEFRAVECIKIGRDSARVDAVLNRLAGNLVAVRSYH